MKNILLLIIIAFAGQFAYAQCTGTTLVISAYIEGSSNNKCIEIYNPTGAAVDLSNCQLERYSNGNTNSTNISLNGTIGAGEYYLACHSSVDMGDLGQAGCVPNLLNSNINHNGDDAYVLSCSGTTQDGIGVVGEDPGSEWSGGGCSTANNSWFKDLSSGTCSTFDPEAGGADYDSYLSTNCGTILTNGAQDDGSGLMSCLGPAPVALSTFTVNPADSKVVLIEWSTASEQNNKYFYIEHSVDGRDFEKIAQIDGAMNSDVMQYYNYIHQDPYNGMNYYRLRQVDENGAFSFSEVEAVRMSEISGFDVRPTIASSEIQIILHDEQPNETIIRIYDILGHLILIQDMERGVTQAKLDIRTLQNGHYFIQINSGLASHTTKFIKK